ncbi:MAG: efflux RND transporter periplasmic adaptor subunit [Betaproteobacteria bacterium]
MNSPVISSKKSLYNNPLTSATAIVLLAAGVLGGCSKPAEVAATVRPALAYKVTSNSGVDADVYPGEIRARHEADHAFRIGGKMVKRLVEQGAIVHRGQALAQLDPLDVKLGAESAVAGVKAAQTEATYADAEYKRFNDLFNKGFVSQSALDQKLNVANAAKARLDSAKAQSNVSSNQAGYATLTAEQDGVVTQVMVEAGQVVAPGQSVMRIANPAEKELLISAPESKIGDFRKLGSAAVPTRDLRIATSSQPDKYYPAKVREVSGAADQVTRTYLVRLSIQGADENIQLGMSAFAVFIGTNDAETLAVPLSALYVKGNTTGVWQIAADGKVSLKPVTVVQYRENAALIKGGIKSGDVIVAAGVHKLREGEVVKPITDPQVTGDGKVAHAPTEDSHNPSAHPKVATGFFGRFGY